MIWLAAGMAKGLRRIAVPSSVWRLKHKHTHSCRSGSSRLTSHVADKGQLAAPQVGLELVGAGAHGRGRPAVPQRLYRRVCTARVHRLDSTAHLQLLPLVMLLSHHLSPINAPLARWSELAAPPEATPPCTHPVVHLVLLPRFLDREVVVVQCPLVARQLAAANSGSEHPGSGG